ncbi:hypothetical protein Patl1_35169 [Pistacia atlantica]|uniref:Uncharacterized protein n=1 Tax=Pistacia atlantica TaxID=434234 RepID=A0ACC0ZVJ7_9ROSI|nr:hypothetical protein Patl1_35169 [Pistacia atlantica]
MDLFLPNSWIYATLVLEDGCKCMWNILILDLFISFIKLFRLLSLELFSFIYFLQLGFCYDRIPNQYSCLPKYSMLVRALTYTFFCPILKCFLLVF